MRRLFVVLSLSCALAGCGGGGGSSGPTPVTSASPTPVSTAAPTQTPVATSAPTASPAPTASATPTASPAPTTAATPAVTSATVAVQAQPFSLPLPSAGGVSAALNFNGISAPPNTTLTAGLANYDSGQSLYRRRRIESGTTPIFQLTFAANNDALIAPGFNGVFDLGSEANGLTSVQVVLVDESGNSTVVGIFSVSNDQVSITLPNSIYLTPGGVYTVEVFDAPTGATPSPITFSTPAPGQIDTTLATNSPSSITIDSTGGYEGVFEVPQVAVSGTCSSPALTGSYSTSPPSGVPAFTGGPGGTLLYFQVTSSCSIVPSAAITASLDAASGGLGAAEYVNGSYAPITGFTESPFGNASNGETEISLSFPASLFTLGAGSQLTFVLYPASN